MKKTWGIVLSLLVLTLVSNGTALAGPVLDRIQKKGELVVGTSGDQPPLNATTKDGKIIGLEVDISTLMASAMGVKLKLVRIPFAELLPALSEGKIDMILSGMTMTGKRNMKTAFVGPYYVTGKAFLTKDKTIASLKHADGIDTPEYTVVALKGSTSQQYVEKVLPHAKLVPTKDYDEALDLLLQDKAHAMVADYHFCAVSAFRYKDKGLTTVEAPFTYEPIGVAMPDGDPLLVNWVQNFLVTLHDSGEMKTMAERWFKDASWLKELP
ncbi:MAG: transporter substrate-binding domain-containing protein [Candidatus Deferrimicrobiaceae bacterium]